ncbi:hypothetical protein, partial [Bacteroides thetaiotaomicron]|uniref:hypothetical protein n=1 Tax=Bacteroides thetaiotaomicron TaxID=818 RepID=UPI0028A2FB11
SICYSDSFLYGYFIGGLHNNIAIQQEEKLSINSTSKKNNLIFSFSALNITELSCSEEQFVIFKNKKKKKRKI